MSWSYAPIGAHVQKVQSWSPVKEGGEELFRYIDLSSVDKERKKISLSDVPMVLPAEAPSRARQLVRKSDVLVSTVRPNLNGVAEVPRSLDGATASTGYCVLRADEKTLHPKFLFYWVQTKTFVLDMIAKATGANYPAVSDRIIKESLIPLPPLDDQKRIAAILDKADNLRRKRQQAIQLADEFLRAVFLDMFGDPVRNQKQYKTSNLGSVADFVAGSTLPPTKEYCGQDEGIAAFKVGDMNCAGNEHFLTIPREWAETFKKSNALVPSGTIVFPKRGGAIGTNKKRITKGQAILDPNLMGVIPGMELTLDYLFSWFQLLDLSTITSGSSVPQLNKRDLDPLKVIIPPRPEMDKYSAICKQFRSWKSCLTRSDKELGILFNSLNQRAFSGSL